MKHYAKARAGIGPYASLAGRRLPDAAYIAHQAFGPQWSAIAGTVREKPNRCQVSDGNDQVLMVWGAPNNFRALLWAAINAAIDPGPRPVIVITTRQWNRLSGDEKQRHITLSERAGLEVRHPLLRDIVSTQDRGRDRA